MNNRNNPKSEKLKVDVVVVGGGGAGLPAAVAAAENGANVLVLEKRNILGGNAGIGGIDTCAIESPDQQREGINYTKDDVFKKAMKNCHWDCNPRVVRAFIDRSGDTIRWLEGMGAQFQLIRMFPDEDIHVFHKVVAVEGEPVAQRLISILTEKCEKLGVQIRRDTGVKKILKNENGEVTGVLAVTKNNEELSIEAKTVVIATGGYAGNTEMVKKHPHYHSNFTLSGLAYDGDGIAMATGIGAATEGIGALSLCGPRMRGTQGVVEFLNKRTLTLNINGKIQEVHAFAVTQEPYTIWVNKNGMRFVDETIGYNHYPAANPIVRQPEGISYTLMDSGILQRMGKKGFVIGLSNAVDKWQAQRGGNIVGLESNLQKLAEISGDIKISDSWDEIAIWMGAKPEVLKATIEEYNTDCDHGHDHIFVKDPRHLLPLRVPPYYALRCQVGILISLGGIKIDENMRVIDEVGNPIPRLYAAGDTTGGWEKVYQDWLISGMTIALVGGRIAGENAAKYSSGV
jgi:fumarate reductase flavoprotein subunit